MSRRFRGKLIWNSFNPVDIHPGEGKKTLLMFLYFFFTIAVLYVLKPVRSSLFLEELGSENLRYVYLGEGLFLIFVTWAYVKLAKVLAKKRLFIGVLAVFISNLILFWWLFHAHVPYLSAFFYIWVACFSITSVTQFWTLANDIFDPLEAKRLFGFIISGGSAGGVLGGLLTNRAVRWMPTEDLLLLSAFLLGGCIYLIVLLWRYMPASSSGSTRGAKPIEPQSTRKLFLTMPYLWMLAGVVIFAKVASTIVDNQFNAIVEDHLIGKAAKTAFFGAFSAWLNIISLLMQLFCTSLSLRFLGIGNSLTLLPAGLAMGSLATFLYPMLATGVFLKIFDGGMNYSIQQASKEVLYLPLPSGVRYRVKPVIDMLGYRVSKSLGGLLIILLAPLFSIPNDRIGILVVALVPFWIFLVWKMRAAYLLLLRGHLWKGGAKAEEVPKPRRATEVLSFLYDEKSFGQLRSLLTEESTVARKLAATACLAYHRAGKDLQAARELVGEMIRREALEAIPEEGSGSKESRGEKEFLDELFLREAQKEAALGSPVSPKAPENAGTLLKHLRKILEAPKQGMAVKREAARFLERRATQEAADQTLEILSGSPNHALRFLLIRTLLRMKDRNPGIRWNRPFIRKEILRETGLYRKIRQLYHFYFRVREKKEEFLEVALGAISDESLERIFRCLGLLYPGEGLRIIYERLLEHPSPDPVRSHAIELLQNLLGPEFSGTVQQLFDERSFQGISEEEAVEFLEQMINSRDPWLSLIAHFLVTELGLGNRWQKLGSLVENHSLESLDL